MAVSILKRPQLFINENQYNATVRAQAGSNLLLVRLSDGSNHGLTTGNFVYIKSSVENYNGWWYITVVSVTEFTIREYSAGSDVQYISTPSEMIYTNVVDYNTTWTSIHLPIVYKLTNTLWPTNSADTVRTMSVTNSNGYCAIAASGDIKATGSAAKLEFVKVTNAGDYNGVYQIIAYTNDTTFTIDLAYSSAADTALTAGNIQYYYNNYVTKVEVWGGLNVEHEFYSVEPYELLGTLDLIPDENNEVKFSISDILKQNIAIKNNLLLGTLPNNLDAFTKFFIKYGEEYDDSDGTTLDRATVSYTSDYSTFQGFAVNSKLPFKNVYAGALSEYLGTSRKFLTSWVRPTVFDGKYFDLSIIMEDTYGLLEYSLRSQRYNGDTLSSTDYAAIANYNSGVWRVPVEVSGAETRIDATLVLRNEDGTHTLTLNAAGSNSDTLELFVPAGLTVPATYNFSVSLGGSVTAGDTANATLTYNYDDGTTEVIVVTARSTAGTTNTGTVALPSPSKNLVSVTLSVLGVDAPAGGLNISVTATVIITGDTIFSEVKTLDANSECLPANAEGIYLSWLNNLGGFDYWYFKAYADDVLEVVEAEESEVNTFPEYPNSVGEFADTIRYETSRKSRIQKVVRSQNLTLAQLQAIKNIKSSILVQIVNSIYDRRTVLVDRNSFKVYTEGQQTTTPYTIEFTITYTDDVASQTV
jgi:hypothetical protein